MQCCLQLNARGATFLEFILAMVLITALAFSCIELARILAFRHLLQTCASETARQLSHHHLSILKEVQAAGRNLSSTETDWNSRIDQDVTVYLSSFPTVWEPDSLGTSPSRSRTLRSRTRVQLELAGDNAGVFVRIEVCLPLLFPSIAFGFDERTGSNPLSFQNGPDRVTKAPLLEPQTIRDCMGSFALDQQSTSVKLQALSFSPFPASSQIYLFGVPEPTNLFGLPGDVLNSKRWEDLRWHSALEVLR